MIERYTIDLGLVVSQNDLEKALHESGDTQVKVPDITKMIARVEIAGDFADLKKVAAMLKETSG